MRNDHHRAREFLQRVSQRLPLVHGGVVDEFAGSLDEYPAWLAGQHRPAPRAGKPAGVRVDTAAARKDQKRREAAERQSLARFNRRIEKAEASLSEAHAKKQELEARLADPSLYEAARKDELRGLLAEQADNTWALAKAEAEWLEATEALERVRRAQDTA